MYRRMWLTKRRAIDRPLVTVPTKYNNTMRFAGLILVSTIYGARGTTYDDLYDEEEEVIHEMIVDEWYDLTKYLMVLSMCIFGLIGLHFHQFASHNFLKRYNRPKDTERRVGRVLSCEPLSTSTSIVTKKNSSTKKKKKENKNERDICGVPVPTFRGKDSEYDSSTTDYVRDEDLKRYYQQTLTDDECTDYRMLVVYKVPKKRKASILCCNPSDKDISISFTKSFGISSSSSLISDTEGTMKAINLYRSKSLPPPMSESHYDDSVFDEKLSGGMDYMNRNNESEYFQWFETSTPKQIDSSIDLILLKGEPTSACTPEVLDSHLAQVGKTLNSKEDRFCHSSSLMGVGLVVAVTGLSLMCFFEIQAMPNPETQRPVGYTVLGTIFAGSIVSAYLIAKLLFEQYKQKVFLSAFMAPSNNIAKLNSNASERSLHQQMPEEPVASMVN